MYKIGKLYKLFLKPEYNRGQSIVYTATILEREGNKLLIREESGTERIIDIDLIGEFKVVGGNNGKTE